MCPAFDLNPHRAAKRFDLDNAQRRPGPDPLGVEEPQHLRVGIGNADEAQIHSDVGAIQHQAFFLVDLQFLAGDRIAVRIVARVAEGCRDAGGKIVGDVVLEDFGFVVNAIPRHVKHLAEIGLEQAMVAQHAERHLLALWRENGATIGSVFNKVAFGHALQHRGSRTGRNAEPLGEIVSADGPATGTATERVQRFRVILDRLRRPVGRIANFGMFVRCHALILAYRNFPGWPRSRIGGVMPSSASPVPTVDQAIWDAARNGSAFIVRGRRGRLAVTGSEGAEYLQGQLTNDIEALEPGGGCYAALLDRKGKMQSDMRVLRIADDEISVETEPEPLPAVERHLQMYKIGRDVEVTDFSAGHAMISVFGPQAVEVAGAGSLANEFEHHKVVLAGVECRGVRTAGGLDLLLGSDAASLEAVAAALEAAGAVPGDDNLLRVLRVEDGIPRFGSEMTETTIPQEAGINTRAVSFTKGCYIGQETVARLHYKGSPNRTLRRLVSDAPMADGETVSTGDREVGTVGTAVVSPALGPVALAVLRREAEPGMEVHVGSGGRATVVEL